MTEQLHKIVSSQNNKYVIHVVTNMTENEFCGSEVFIFTNYDKGWQTSAMNSHQSKPSWQKQASISFYQNIRSAAI